MKTLIQSIFLLITFNSFAQTEYVNPAILRQDIYSIEIKDIFSTKQDFKFAFIIENKSNTNYLIFDLAKIAITFSPDEVYYPKNDEVVVVVVDE